MPIGENAMKRVENNGYSKVQTSCPDMENSSVEETPAPAKPDKKKKSVSKTVNVSSGKDGFERVEVGQKMPYWLL